ncbi:Histone-lysine N-methyltransferase SETMAR [Eumeta japonica]|uniref:Histone-lysine N-methyltransferase SETMAR n=1 Tax=Eumeta variegata TaxID=151549 RepID=A0A4C1X6S1_EUMVA|nr:Histone-lysine N-methyltransferase SETMAR [Eumeta japonica]
MCSFGLLLLEDSKNNWENCSCSLFKLSFKCIGVPSGGQGRPAVATAAVGVAGFEILEHFPYFLDLASSDFYLFSRVKEYMKGQRFEDDEAVVAAVQEFLGPQDEEFSNILILTLFPHTQL